MPQNYLIKQLFFIKVTKRKVSQEVLLALFFPLFLTSCLPSHKAQVKSYREVFANHNNAVPDYGDLLCWAAHPNKKDPSDSVPSGLPTNRKALLADVFFIHPTTYLTNKRRPVAMNASISDATINAKTDYSSILYQASVFNGSCLVYAPRYRQAHISAFFTKDTMASQAAFELAYRDIKAAFEYYLTNHNDNRPIIIASHSQGTLLAGRLLREYFENKSLSNQLVVAYLWGLPIPPHYFNQLSLCNDAAQTNCFVGWRLFKTGYIPSYIKAEQYVALTVNPLSWRSDSMYVGRSNHLGAVLFNFNKVYTRTQGARIHKGVVWIDKPKFPFSFLYTKRNYHAGDINLFYIDIRKNVQDRIDHFLRLQSQ